MKVLWILKSGLEGIGNGTGSGAQCSPCSSISTLPYLLFKFSLCHPLHHHADSKSDHILVLLVITSHLTPMLNMTNITRSRLSKIKIGNERHGIPIRI
jgi:hypothetical protein